MSTTYDHSPTPAINFGWNWLEKGKNKEENSGDEDINPKHRRKSWSEVVKGTSKGGNSDPKAAPSQIKNNTTYKDEEVLALLAAAKEVAGGTAKYPKEEA